MVMNLKCTIELDGLDDIKAKHIKETIKRSGVDAGIRQDAIFIDADIDNSGGFIESLATYLAGMLTNGQQTTMSIKSLDGIDIVGDTIDGYYDIIIEDGAAYKVPYCAVQKVHNKTEVSSDVC